MIFPFVSVVVVAYKAENEIINCLDSLMSQTYSHENYEIIVVVDDEGTYNVIKNYPIIIHYRKTKGNIPSARNIGFRLSKGKIVAYTDSDCVVPVEWLESIARSFINNPQISGVGGLIKPYGKDPVSSSIALLNMVGYSSGSLSYEIPFPTSNAAYQKEVLNLVGGFDEKALVGEDMDIYRRIKEKNLYLLFDPSIYVHHKHRTELFNIFMWCSNVKKRSWYVSKKYFSVRNIFRQITPFFLVVLYLALLPSFIFNNIFLLSTLLIVFCTYIFIFYKYRKSEFFSLSACIMLPFVALTISSGFFWGILVSSLQLILGKKF